MPVEICSLTDALDNALLLQQWGDLEALSENLYSMYGSVEWLSSLGTCNDRYKILYYMNDHQSIENIVPLEILEKDVALSPFGSFPISMKLRTASLLCSEPFGAVNTKNFIQIFRHIFENNLNLTNIYFKNIYVNSLVHKAIKASINASSQHICCVESAPRKFHTLVLKESFESYLATFSKKERYNLKRQCRMAKEAAGGILELRPVTSDKEIEFLASSSKTVLSRSWKSHLGEADLFFSEQRCREYANLATNGILRSYVLLGNNEPWAFVLGYQRKGIFHYANIAYDESHARLSPGTVLFYLMLEDLHKNDKPTILNFGVGESSYKKRFGTDIQDDCNLMIMKKNMKNRLICCWLTAMNKLRLLKKRYLDMGNTQKSLFVATIL